jgi:hypothetical protein
MEDMLELMGTFAAHLEEASLVWDADAIGHDVVGCTLYFVVGEQGGHDSFNLLHRVHRCKVRLKG